MDITQLASALGAYNRKYPAEIAQAFYNQADDLSKHCRTISKVNGTYPVIHSLTDRLVKGFTGTWSATGTTSFKARELRARHLAVNYQFKPADILPSYQGDMYSEGAALADKTISRYIMQKELIPRVQEDVNELMCTGTYNAGALGVFGNAMNGLAAVITAGKSDAVHPMYKIPVAAAITEANAMDELTAFERELPRGRKFKIFCSANTAENYRIDYENTLGTNVNFKEDYLKTRLRKIEIVPLEFLPDTVMFAVPDGNMVKLIDVHNGPKLTDIQVLDYDVKVFMECHLGIDFAVNQLVFVADFGGANLGYPAAVVGTDIYWSGQKTHA